MACVVLAVMVVILTAAQNVPMELNDSTALSKFFSTSFSVAAEVGISLLFCFRFVGLSCAFPCNLFNSLDIPAAGTCFALEVLQQIRFLNLVVVYSELLGVPLLKKALGKQPVVFKKLRFTEKL